MSTLLLATKLFIPMPRPNAVARSRLLQKLDDGLQKQGIILVSAPAGFGKTSLVSDWVQKNKLPTAWLSLDEGDNDPNHFWQYIAAAFQTINPALGQNFTAALQAPKPSPLPVLITSLINDLTTFATEIILVLDDYHLIENEPIHESLNFFIDHLYPGVHLLVSTRSDPPLQLSRRRGRAALCEIRAADLRFNTAEAAELFNDGMKLGLAAADIRLLEQRTEGWITGLQMAGLSMDGLADKHHFVAAFNSDDRYVADYLIEEVLHRQPAHIQEFLLKTAVLDQLSASLCDAVLETDHSQAVLNDLERANLFIFPLDNRREWYRYHHLFASLLRQRLQQTSGKEALCSLQRKASAWFEKNNMLVEAIQMLFNCGDLPLAASLLDKRIDQIFAQGELMTLNRFGEKVPADLLKTHPHLLMALSWVANATGQVAKMEKYTTILQQLFNLDLDTFLAMPDISTLDVQARSALIEIAVLQSRTALDHFDFPLVERIANRVLPYLVPEHDNDPFLFNKPSHLRPPLVYMLGFYNQLIGNLDVAAHMLSDAAESAAALYNIHIIALALGQSGQVNLARGALYQAEIDFQKSIDAVQAAPEMPTAYVSQAWYGLACLAYEWNDLQQVEIFIQNALETGKRWQSYELIFPAYMLLARRYALAEDWTRVHENLRLMQQMPPEFLKSTGAFLDHFQAWVEFRQGRPERLQHWVDGFTPAEFTPTPFVQEMEAISAARLLMALGRIDQGIQLLEPFLSALQNSSRRGRLVEALVVKSMLLAAQNKAVEAQTVLAQALEIAQPQHYVRLFVDEGESMQRLLEKYIPTLSGDMKAYAQSILHAFPQAAPPLPASHPNMEGLVDALSEREIEVLNLMVSGISNAEMASRLFVSVNTVKKHITNIFNKLGVKNRLQAIKQGRQLGLIES